MFIQISCIIPSNYPSFRLSIHPSIHPSMPFSINLFLLPFMHPCMHPSIQPSFHPCIHLSKQHLVLFLGLVIFQKHHKVQFNCVCVCMSRWGREGKDTCDLTLDCDFSNGPETQSLLRRQQARDSCLRKEEESQGHVSLKNSEVLVNKTIYDLQAICCQFLE